MHTPRFIDDDPSLARATRRFFHENARAFPALLRGRMKAALAVLALGSFAAAHGQPPEIALRTSSDFLALHVSGKAPAGCTAMQYRLAAEAEWAAAKTTVENGGAFSFDVPLKTSRWPAVQVRALAGEAVLATREVRYEPRAPRMLTPERIAALPERAAWEEYLRESDRRRDADYDALAAECRPLGLARAHPAPSNRAQFDSREEARPVWFTTEEAGHLADVVMSFQTPGGGWSKAVAYTHGARPPGTHWTSQTGEDGWHYCGTLDNRSTTEQVRFLAKVFVSTMRTDARDAMLRGIEWLLAAQFPNGGWPQNYPIEPGYHEAITLNDDAMTHAMETMLDVSEATPLFSFVDETLRQRARAAFEKGLACLAAAQVKVEGTATVWCAQHDPLTLAPVGARPKEPPSLSGAESANLLKFFMRRAPLDPRITAMIEPALAWLDAHRIAGLRYSKNAEGRTDYVPDAASGEIYWARFYDIATGRPVFFGGQDGIAYATFGEMAAHNKLGYDYYTTKPRDLLEKEVLRWRKRMERGK